MSILPHETNVVLFRFSWTRKVEVVRGQVRHSMRQRVRVHS